MGLDSPHLVPHVEALVELLSADNPAIRRQAADVLASLPAVSANMTANS